MMVTIKVERGNPTPEELAAVVALVQARAAAAADAGSDEDQDSVDEWAAPARNVPPPAPRPAPDAWRTSYWPH